MNIDDTLSRRTADVTRDVSGRVAELTEELRAAVGGLIDRITALRKRITFIESGLLPQVDFDRRVKRYVARIGSRWLQDQGYGVTLGEWGLLRPAVADDNVDMPWYRNDPIPWGAICAAEPDRAEQIIRTLAAARPAQGEVGPPMAERPALLTALQAELADLQAAHERLVDDAARSGITLEHLPEVVERRRQEARDARLEAERLERVAWSERQAQKLIGR